MTQRRALALINGQTSEIPATDQILCDGGAAVGTSAIRQLTVSAAGAGQFRYDDNGLNYPLALANTGMTAAGHGVGVQWTLGTSQANAVPAARLSATALGTFADASTRATRLTFSALDATGSLATLGTWDDAAGLTLPKRPTFAGNVPWDAGNFNPANDGTTLFAVRYGVQAGTVVDQAPAIMACINSLPAAGGGVVLPAGIIYVNQTILSTRQNMTLKGAGQQATIIMAMSGFTSGDVFKMTGNYSNINDIGFQQQQTTAQAQASADQAAYTAAGNTAAAETSRRNSIPYRTAGYTINMTGAYQLVARVSIQHCYIAINIAISAGMGGVTWSDITYMTPSSKAAGSGGIVINTPTYGPACFIDHVLCYGDNGSLDGSVTPRPTFGINILNSGETNMSCIDILGFQYNLLINPGDTKTAQATYLVNSVLDSAQTANVAIVPTGTGYVFDFHATNSWLTNTITTGSRGMIVYGGTATGNNSRPVMLIKFTHGIIVSNTPSPSDAVVIDGKASDVTISGNTISGWNIGVNVGANASHVTVTDNAIGKYSPFGGGTITNDTGIALTSGTGDWLMVKDNRLYGNTSYAINNQSPSGTNKLVRNNLGSADIY